MFVMASRNQGIYFSSKNLEKNVQTNAFLVPSLPFLFASMSLCVSLCLSLSSSFCLSFSLCPSLSLCFSAFLYLFLDFLSFSPFIFLFQSISISASLSLSIYFSVSYHLFVAFWSEYFFLSFSLNCQSLIVFLSLILIVLLSLCMNLVLSVRCPFVFGLFLCFCMFQSSILSSV